MAHTIKVSDETFKILQKYSKAHRTADGEEYPIDASADDLIDYANGRLEALERYNEKKRAKKPAKGKKFSGNRLSSPGVRRGKAEAASA